MANLNHSICVVCCHKITDNPFQQNVNANPTLVKWFSKLKNGKFDTKDKPGLSSPLPVLCSECLSIMNKVGDKREEVDKVEEQVRCLQQQLLIMLRHLSSLVGDYLEEMKAVEGKIRGSEEQRDKLKKEEDDPGSENEEVLKSILGFREHILAEIQELGHFQCSLTSKLITTATDEVEPLSAEIEVKIETEDDLRHTEFNDFVEVDPPSVSDSGWEPDYQNEEEIKIKPFQEEIELGSRRPKRRAATSATKKMAQLKPKRPAKVKREPQEDDPSSLKTAQEPVKRTLPTNYEPAWITWKRHKLHVDPRGTQRKKQFTCQSCPKKPFQKIYGLEQHLRFHEAECTTDTKKYSCPHCPLSFSLEQRYQLHLCCHEGIIKAECDTCHKGQLVFDLERHLKEDHKILKPIQCPNCFHFSSNRDKFLKHLKYHLGKDAVLPCDLCPVTYNTRKELLEHLHKEHQVLDPIPCGIGNCTRTFLDRGWLNNHRILHTKKFACLVCDKACASELNLKTHLKSHQEKRWNCEHCGKKMTSKEVLEEHLKKHEGGNKPVTNFQCHLCEKGFVHQSSFQDHLDWHNGRIHKCDQCEATFTHRRRLRHHLEEHANPGKSFVCHVCGTGFKRNQHLKVHLLTHSEEKKFECEHCTKRFMRKDQLKQHLRVHSGEKPYVCEICGKAFNQAGSLWHHKRLIHPQSQVDSKSPMTN